MGNILYCMVNMGYMMKFLCIYGEQKSVIDDTEMGWFCVIFSDFLGAHFCFGDRVKVFFRQWLWYD